MIAQETRQGGPTALPRWLVISNCQTIGLANCLTLLTDQITVEYYDPPAFSARKDEIVFGLDNFDRVLIAPAIETAFNLKLGSGGNVWRIPPIFFAGYHPDTCNLSAQGPLASGPLGHYHSALAYAGFRCGLSETRTLSLFNEESFYQLGYFDRWDLDRDRLLSAYSRCGFDMHQAFANWSRQGPFMHTFNHPKITCLHDFAKVLLARAGLSPITSDHLPHDNLANGPVYPVYPEIGARFGVGGSYQFKAGAAYKLRNLEHYVEQCFRVYRDHASIEPSLQVFFATIENAISYVKATK